MATKTTTVIDYSLDDFKSLLIESIFNGRDINIEFVVKEVEGDRFPGQHQVTRVRVSFEGSV